MSRLTEVARNQTCTVRLPCCSGDPATTVLAHYRSVRLGAGTSLKPHDLIGAWACNRCHDEIDRRTRHYSHEEARHAHLEGCLETIIKLTSMGKVKA